MTAGHSGTPLASKLGIAPGQEVLLLGDPGGFDLLSLGVPVHPAPTGTEPGDQGPSRRSAGHHAAQHSTTPDPASAGGYQVVLLFCPDAATLVDLFDRAKGAHTRSGAVWVCWPKKSSGVRTDLTGNAVREFGLGHGRVDVKVAAIDANWSGLKFVIRLADRM